MAGNEDRHERSPGLTDLSVWALELMLAQAVVHAYNSDGRTVRPISATLSPHIIDASNPRDYKLLAA